MRKWERENEIKEVERGRQWIERDRERLKEREREREIMRERQAYKERKTWGKIVREKRKCHHYRVRHKVIMYSRFFYPFSGLCYPILLIMVLYEIRSPRQHWVKISAKFIANCLICSLSKLEQLMMLVRKKWFFQLQI
jgi:hypothetical protein